MLDLSLYLVTGSELLPTGKTYLNSLREALEGGVTVVQIREKHADTAEFLDIARQSKELCDHFNVPMLINDRIDVALAIGASGVHLGQTDMPVSVAKSLLPKGSLIGVSCNTAQEVKQAIKDGVDYIGIGPVWTTQTKENLNPVIGVRGVGLLLEALDGTNIKAVAIGGIKGSNLLRTLHGSVSVTNHALDGVAVVSEIVASKDPKTSSENLLSAINAFRSSQAPHQSIKSVTPESILSGVTQLMTQIRSLSPLVHQITNQVVITQSANVTLALGASPIMATTPEEMEDLSKIPGALLVNIGTLQSDGRKGMLSAGYYANLNQKPVVMDPVGVGATAFRKEMVNELLDTWQASVIKGNAGELAALSGSAEVESKGVDSVGPGFKDPAQFVKRLAKQERCVVVLTGATDYISDGERVVTLNNGHPLLGAITGSGCMVGSAIASYCAVAAASSVGNNKPLNLLVNGDMLMAAITGVLMITVAAEVAVTAFKDVGPGTFISHFIDAISQVGPEEIRARAKISVQ